ncbi:MAG: helix-turn-helix transcriptional regulator [Saprospiraceae bacterium]|nr:helix-turn-helix transcriptional regulator [Saprospiraceae bacterium]
MALVTNTSGVIYIDTYFESGQILNLYNNHLQNHTAIINAASRSSFVPSHWGPTSLKFSLSGEEKYTLDRRQYAVNLDHFLILNEGSEYATTIDSNDDVHIFTINFSKEFSINAFRQPEISRIFLDELKTEENNQPEFVEKLFPFENSWKSEILDIKELVESRLGSASLELDEKLNLLFGKMAHAHNDCLNEISHLSLKKKSTRIELYRRLCFVKDYIHSNFKKELTLKELSHVGLLSEFYLIRHYKQLFSLTPFEYLIQLRMQKAHALIACTDLPVQTVCNMVGYNDHSSFSKLFKKHFHLPPAKLRLLTRN